MRQVTSGGFNVTTIDVETIDVYDLWSFRFVFNKQEALDVFYLESIFVDLYICCTKLLVRKFFFYFRLV